MPSQSTRLSPATLNTLNSPKADSEGESLPISDSELLPDGEPTLWRLTNATDNLQS